MATEEKAKQLLIKDLCARLFYGVKISKANVIYPMTGINIALGYVELAVSERLLIEEARPYLRPMSSMTEEEKTWATASYEYNKLTYGMDYAITAYVDYLYSIHIDCHGLIPKGLALPAPEGMYDLKFKKEK